MTWFAIAAGGALGAMARHALNGLFHGRFNGFPAGIFVVNIIGCLAIGVLAGLLASARLQVGDVGRNFLIVGLLGGFTTFSSFGLDTFILSRGGLTGLAALNAAGQPIVGIAAVWLGYVLGSGRP